MAEARVTLAEREDRASEPSIFDADHRTVCLGLISLVTMTAFEAVAVSIAMPTVARSLDGIGLYPVAIAGLITTSVIGMVLCGRYGDARGPRLPILLGGLGFIVGLVVSGTAHDMYVFTAGRLVQGLGAGSILTAAYVVVGRAVAPTLRTKVFALFAAAWVVPSIVGPLIAGVLLSTLGWRSVFLVVAGASAIALVALLRGTRHLSDGHGPVTWGRAPLIAVLVGVGALTLHLAGQTHGWTRVGIAVVAVALVAATTPRLLPAGTFGARPGLPSVILLRSLIAGSFASTESFMPLLLQHRTDISPTLAGLVMTVGSLGWSGGSTWVGRHDEARATGRHLVLGTTCLVLGGCVGIGLVAVATTVALAIPIALVGVVLLGIGMGTCTPLTSTMVLAASGPNDQGSNGSALQLGDAVAQTLTAGCVGLVFAGWHAAHAGSSYLAGFVPTLVLALLAAAVARRAATVAA